MLNDEFVTRLVAELDRVKLDITARPLTIAQLWDKSYEYVIKYAIVDMFTGENNQLYRYTDAIITGIMQEENVLHYLYGIWKDADYMLQGAFADTFYEELLYRRGSRDE
ncbi:MAG: hypothetical protein UEA60_09920 [Lachnospiraceae bacterium]|nr:hypothetical protein [Lachnospiraceae bacterium]